MNCACDILKIKIQKEGLGGGGGGGWWGHCPTPLWPHPDDPHASAPHWELLTQVGAPAQNSLYWEPSSGLLFIWKYLGEIWIFLGKGGIGQFKYFGGLVEEGGGYMSGKEKNIFKYQKNV